MQLSVLAPVHRERAQTAYDRLSGEDRARFDALPAPTETHRALLRKALAVHAVAELGPYARRIAKHDAAAALAAMCRAAAESKPFQLILADKQMPDMTGQQLAQAAQGIPAIRGARVVLLTSPSDTLSTAQHHALHLCGVAHKPPRNGISHRESSARVMVQASSGCAAPHDSNDCGAHSQREVHVDQDERRAPWHCGASDC